jgi:hypothetical protein
VAPPELANHQRASLRSDAELWEDPTSTTSDAQGSFEEMELPTVGVEHGGAGAESDHVPNYWPRHQGVGRMIFSSRQRNDS